MITPIRRTIEPIQRRKKGLTPDEDENQKKKSPFFEEEEEEEGEPTVAILPHNPHQLGSLNISMIDPNAT